MGAQLNISGLLEAPVPANASMGEGAFGFYGLGVLACLHASTHDWGSGFLSGKFSRLPKAFPAETTAWLLSCLSAVFSPATPHPAGAVGTGVILKVLLVKPLAKSKMSKPWKGFGLRLPS